MSQKSPVQIIVIWQSLVVKTYRSFFYKLSMKDNIQLGLVSPDKFSELGFQTISCQPFDSSETIKTYTLKAKIFHAQIVLFKNLSQVLKDFFIPKQKKIIFCLAEPYSITALLVWLKARILYSKQFDFLLFSLQNIKKSFPKPLHMIQNFLFKKASAIAVLGPEQEEVIRANGYQGRTFPFPLWFDSEKFKRMDESLTKNILQNQLPNGIRAESLKVAYVGALVEQKGVRDILDSIGQNHQSFSKNIDLFFVGKGDLEKEVQNFAHEMNHDKTWVHSLGFVPHEKMGALFNYFNILLVPSRTRENWKEQFGRVIIEAQACGCLVLGSDSGHIPYLIDKEYCFKEGDSEGITKSIKRAITEYQENPTNVVSKNLMKASKYSDTFLADKFAKQLKFILA